MTSEAERELLLRVAGKIGADLDLPTHEPEPYVILTLYGAEARTISRVLREAAEGWQDIASAPKDGTVVLLYCPQGDGSPGSTYRVTAGNWESDPGGITEHRDLEGRWIGQDESDGWEGWMSWDGGFSEDTMMPSHWRPLPPPPATETTNSQEPRHD